MFFKSTYLFIIYLASLFFVEYSCVQNSTIPVKEKAKSTTTSPLSELSVLREQRQKAKHRTRRIIMNNDGNDFEMLGPENLEHVEKFLEKRTAPLIHSHVDSIFYCTGVFNMYTHPVEGGESRHSNWINPKMMATLKERNIDSLKMMIDFCRQHDKEIFWSMRMNDTHDSLRPECFAQWKKDNPHYLVGKKEDRYKKMKYGGRRWSSLDYNHPQVRDKVYHILADICHRYDVDGIELDFFRHPVIFKEQMVGQDITQAQRDIFTELMRRIRRMTEEEGLRKGKPILIAIRIPDSMDYCRALGLDAPQWLEENLVDIVIGSDYFKLEPWENLVALGRQYHVPVYACIEERRIAPEWGGAEDLTSVTLWRGEAYNAWKAGVNGIYTFNRFDPHDKIFYEIGDPKMLETLECVDQTVFVNKKSWSRPETWLKNGGDYVKEKK